MATGESFFHWIAIALIIPVFSTSMFFRWRANRTKEPLSARKEEGSRLLAMRTVFGISMWLGTLIYLINPNWMAWSKLPLPEWTRWTGAALMLLCTPLFFWIFTSLGKNVTPTTAIRANHTLVISGPYRWVRHPLYTAGFLFFAGLCMLSSNGFIALTVIGGAFILAARTPIEETRLIDKFGDDYRHYMSKTGRYFPQLGR